MRNVIIIAFVFIIPFASFGQEYFFSNLTIGKNFRKNQCTYNTSGVWKHIYNDTEWSRISAKAKIDYNYKSWQLISGLTVLNTFDSEIVNSIELRPWLGINLKNTIIEDLQLEQEARLEWRSFFYQNKHHANYIRTTFDLGLNYNLDKIKLRSYSIQVGFIWYFIKSPILGERYADSREFRFLLNRSFTNGKLTLGYKHEKFKPIVSRLSNEFHTLEISYLFN